MDICRDIFESNLQLSTILISIYEKDIDWINQVTLCFDESNFISLYPINETDEISIVCSKEVAGIRDMISVENIFPWIQDYYKSIASLYWIMTNNKGYTDAIQFEFAKPGVGEFILQFKVIASRIYFYKFINLY